ncbi:MAG: phasin family protein [Pseudomonadota bacterium]
MTSLPEQFQAARQFQLDQQFSFLRNLGNQALDRTSRLVALNLDLSRATVEHSSSTVRQLMAVRDPRDLLTIGAQSQRQLRTMFDYGHELFNIATGLRGAALQTWSVAAAAPAPALAAPAQVVESAVEAVQETVKETVKETASATEQVAKQVTKQVSEPAPVSVSAAAADLAPDAAPIVTSSIAPPVEPTPIAKATSEILDVPLAPHPVAASVPVDVDVEIELPKVEPVDATPPVAPPSNGAPKVTEIRSGRGRRKGN